MGAARGVVLALRTAQGFPVLLHQSGEDLLPDLDAEAEEGVLGAGEDVEHRKRDLDRNGLEERRRRRE